MDQTAGKQEVVIVGTPLVTLTGRQEVILTDVHIPFGSLVVLLVKVAIAAIPAALIFSLCVLFFASIFMALVYMPRM